MTRTTSRVLLLMVMAGALLMGNDPGLHALAPLTSQAATSAATQDTATQDTIALERRAATDADRSMQEARTLRTTALGLEAVGKYAEARPLLERALALAEAVRGPDDLSVIALVRNLASNALDTNDYARAEPLYQRALAVLEKTYGAEYPDTAYVQSRLATIYARAGQRPKADALLRRSLEILEKTVGTDHPWYVSGLLSLALFRLDAFDREKAAELDRRALAILERTGDTGSLMYAHLLGNLGDVLGQLFDYVPAQEYLQRSLALGERLHGPDSLFVAGALQNLGIIARQLKDYPTAEAHLTRALAIRQRLLGAEHPETVALMVNLANVQASTGDHAKSLDTLLRALRILDKTSSPYSRLTLLTIVNIAKRYVSLGDIANAVAFQGRLEALVEKDLQLQLSIGSERQKLAFAFDVTGRTVRTISLSLREAAGNADASALAATVLLQRKGRVLDAMIDMFAAIRQRIVDTNDKALLDQLNATTTQLAQVALSASATRSAEERQQQLTELEAKKEQIEIELSDHNAELRAQLRPVTLEAVQAAIPDEAALVEFTEFFPFDPNAVREMEAFGAPRYAAYVMRKQGPPRAFDLGPAQAIDEAIDALRQALRDPTRTSVKRYARALDEQVMRPLRAAVGDATRLLISPDGDLNLVPVETLIDERGQYLIERYAISYLTSGRDLLRMQTAVHANLGPPVIVANPSFGEPAPQLARASARTARRGIVAQDVSTVYFAPLGGTASEARAIKALFPEATLLTGPRATKATLTGVEAPSMLHIASHGFFLEDAAPDDANAPAAPASATASTATARTAAPSAAPAPAPVAAPTAGSTRAMSASVRVENPLLRSGLALAGANLRRGAHDDGILTALEASGMHLWGTKLVTLSACDTGVGEVRAGEGVYGLRRAIVLAGAETLVMSLWPVNDLMTRQMMTAYYTGLRAGLGRGDALRQAKIAILKKQSPRQTPGHPSRHPFEHPYYWASFIQSGEWASLDGAR